MSDEVINWIAVGDRWLEKKQCDECESKGFHIKSITKECPKCDNIGYLETEGHDIILCPKCLGMRQINSEKKSSCIICSGRGFSPAIMQNFEAEVECSNCEGKGYHEGDEVTHINNCYHCEGSGRSTSKECIPLSQWKSNKSRPSLEDYAEGDPDEDGWLNYRSGIMARSVNCGSCRNYDIILARSNGSDKGDESLDCTCNRCEGRGRYIETTLLCEKCEGSGTMPVYNRYECEDCDETGMITIEEEREV